MTMKRKNLYIWIIVAVAVAALAAGGVVCGAASSAGVKAVF